MEDIAHDDATAEFIDTAVAILRSPNPPGRKYLVGDLAVWKTEDSNWEVREADTDGPFIDLIFPDRFPAAVHLASHLRELDTQINSDPLPAGDWYQ